MIDDLDLIMINDSDGNKIEAELVSNFSIEDKEYVLYRVGDTIYGARYEIENGNTKLITDLDEIEKAIINDVASSLEVE